MQTNWLKRRKQNCLRRKRSLSMYKIKWWESTLKSYQCQSRWIVFEHGEDRCFKNEPSNYLAPFLKKQVIFYNTYDIKNFFFMQETVICFQNCSDILWEKNVLVKFEAEVGLNRTGLKAENLQTFWDHYSPF